MPTPKPERKYSCSQAELYAISKIGWDSCEENLADFTAHKVFYDAGFITARRAELAAAKVLPDDQARGEGHEVLGIQMKQAADDAQFHWNKLRSYIQDAFAPELVKPKEESAGYNYYPTASNDDWEDLEAMLTAGQTFITNNNGELTLPGGMPAGFPAAYSGAMTVFANLYGNFKDAEQDSEEGTSEKITANNDVYTRLTKMFDDGQLIYVKNAAKRERFIFAQVKELVSGSSGGSGGGGGGSETVLQTFDGVAPMSAIISHGPLSAGALKMRMTVFTNGPLEGGLGDGAMFNGNTMTQGSAGTIENLITYFASSGTTIMVRNQSPMMDCSYRVEILG